LISRALPSLTICPALGEAMGAPTFWAGREGLSGLEVVIFSPYLQKNGVVGVPQ
jgi:hypothetical protein